MTAGDWNAHLSLWIFATGVTVFNFFRRLYYEILLIDTVFSIRESPRGRFVSMKNAAPFRTEILSIEMKHLTELISIFSVKDIPKIPLRKTHAVEIEGVVNHSWSRETETLNIKLADPMPPQLEVHSFTQVPMWILHDLFVPESGAETVPSPSKSNWWIFLKEIVLGNRKIIDNDMYRSAEDSVPTSMASAEIMIQRVHRFLARFELPQDAHVLQLDAHRDEDEFTVPFMTLSRRANDLRGRDDMARLDFFLGEETVTVFFDPYACCFQPFATIPSFYGIDDKTCTICCDANIDTLLIDCCHCAACEACANSLRDNRCPICRNGFTEKLIIPINVS